MPSGDLTAIGASQTETSSIRQNTCSDDGEGRNERQIEGSTLHNQKLAPCKRWDVTIYWELLTAKLDELGKGRMKEAIVEEIARRPGATDQELDAFEQKLGLGPLPEDFRKFYRIHNGWEPHYFSYGYFCDLTEILEQKKVWEDLFGDNGSMREFNVRDENSEFSDIDKINAWWWNSSWLPFIHDGCGDFVCLDFDPALPNGKLWQVISMDHEISNRKFLGPSLAAFLLETIENPDNFWEGDDDQSAH